MKRARLQVQSAAVFLFLAFFCVKVYAQITPSGDSYTNTATPTTNYGSKPLLDVDATSQVTYIRFDLSSIPSGASVNQATLKLYVNSVTTAGSFNVNYVIGSWSEGTITSSNAPAQGNTIASGVVVGAAEKNQYLLINVTPAVQAWLDGSQPNDGIVLVANSTFNATFDSKENATTSHAPELDIVYAAIAGVNTASGSGLMGGGTSGTLNLSLTNSCAANQVLQWNGSAWACSSAGGGTVTSVATGTGLKGGPITSSGTLSIDATQVPLLNAGSNNFIGNQNINGNLNILNNANFQPLSVQSSSTFGTWLNLINTSTGGKQWSILSAGGTNAEGAGNLGITNFTGTSTIFLEGNVQAASLNSTGNVTVGGNLDMGFSYVIGPTTTVTSGTEATLTAICPSGTVIMSGGFDISPGPNGAQVLSSVPGLVAEDRWVVRVFNNGGSDVSAVAEAVCARLVVDRCCSSTQPSKSSSSNTVHSLGSGKQVVAGRE